MFPAFTGPPEEGPSSPRDVGVSVTVFIFTVRVVNPTPDPQPGEPGAVFRLTSPLKPFPAWFNLPAHKPPHHDKVAAQGEATTYTVR